MGVDFHSVFRGISYPQAMWKENCLFCGKLGGKCGNGNRSFPHGQRAELMLASMALMVSAKVWSFFIRVSIFEMLLMVVE